MGWEKVVTDGIEVKVIPNAGHSGMFQEPYVRLLARELGEALDRIQKEKMK